MLEAQQRGIEANPGYDFYNLNIDAGSMWTRRIVARMIAAEQGTDTGGEESTSGQASAAMNAVTGAANSGDGHESETGQPAEVAAGVAYHRDEPAAGLMARGL
jgi:hypothetical protein